MLKTTVLHENYIRS